MKRGQMQIRRITHVVAKNKGTIAPTMMVDADPLRFGLAVPLGASRASNDNLTCGVGPREWPQDSYTRGLS